MRGLRSLHQVAGQEPSRSWALSWLVQAAGRCSYLVCNLSRINRVKRAGQRSQHPRPPGRRPAPPTAEWSRRNQSAEAGLVAGRSQPRSPPD